MFLRFKYPESTCSEEELAELRAIFSQIVFLISNWNPEKNH